MSVSPAYISAAQADRYTAQLESALLARALADAGALPDERAQAAFAAWTAATFNTAAAALPGRAAEGVLTWEPEGAGYCLIWQSPSGLFCRLARLYPQENGTWAALVVAGVRDTPEEAMAAAEWASSRLAA